MSGPAGRAALIAGMDVLDGYDVDPVPTLSETEIRMSRELMVQAAEILADSHPKVSSWLGWFAATGDPSKLPDLWNAASAITVAAKAGKRLPADDDNTGWLTIFRPGFDPDAPVLARRPASRPTMGTP